MYRFQPLEGAALLSHEIHQDWERSRIHYRRCWGREQKSSHFWDFFFFFKSDLEVSFQGVFSPPPPTMTQHHPRAALSKAEQVLNFFPDFLSVESPSSTGLSLRTRKRRHLRSLSRYKKQGISPAETRLGPNPAIWSAPADPQAHRAAHWRSLGGSAHRARVLVLKSPLSASDTRAEPRQPLGWQNGWLNQRDFCLCKNFRPVFKKKKKSPEAPIYSFL